MHSIVDLDVYSIKLINYRFESIRSAKAKRKYANSGD